MVVGEAAGVVDDGGEGLLFEDGEERENRHG